ncbi:hypothetical protein B0J11DRAFT_545700 [Dendryphion nanum]|uniref:Uncharacterized protein n=1 Tax=Dendryphion nanum TaxID=256645 RepID=A0A9P9CWB3_9PLEO|nr:hypothetical protein B0J11DRAFT_545700 [Dendryphion nanum]
MIYNHQGGCSTWTCGRSLTHNRLPHYHTSSMHPHLFCASCKYKTGERCLHRSMPVLHILHTIEKSLLVSLKNELCLFNLSNATTQLEFVDEFNPQKNRIVRRKAREWVFSNREIRKGDVSRNKVKRVPPRRRAIIPSPNPGSGCIDPFHVLPNVGRNVDHIIRFYHHSSHLRFHILTSSMILSQPPKDTTDELNWQSTVLGIMANERISFILWLFATSLIRDVVTRNYSLIDAKFYHLLAVKTIQEESKEVVDRYSDSFLSSLACFSACSNFIGNYTAAIAHRDAMIRVITLKGSGNLKKGIQSCTYWAQRAVVWCEIHVAAQASEVPRIPYHPRPVQEPLPRNIAFAAESLTLRTLSHLPPLSPVFERIISSLHQLSLLLSERSQRVVLGCEWPGYLNVDPVGVHLLYRAEYMILQLLSAQKVQDHGFSPIECVFTEACQLFLWSAIRGLPFEMRMFDIFVRRLQEALKPVICRNKSNGAWEDHPALLRQPRISLEFVFTWALVLGTLLSSVGPRSQYAWFKEQLVQQIFVKNTHIIRTAEALKDTLKLFPYTDTLFECGTARLGIVF